MLRKSQSLLLRSLDQRVLEIDCVAYHNEGNESCGRVIMGECEVSSPDEVVSVSLPESSIYCK